MPNVDALFSGIPRSWRTPTLNQDFDDMDTVIAIALSSDPANTAGTVSYVSVDGNTESVYLDLGEVRPVFDIRRINSSGTTANGVEVGVV